MITVLGKLHWKSIRVLVVGFSILFNFSLRAEVQRIHKIAWSIYAMDPLE